MKIDGIYQKTLFRNIKTGYAYFQFKSLKYDDDGENFYKCRGVIPNYAPKTPLTLIGHKEDNGKETIFIVEEISLNINNDILTKSFVMAHLEAGMGSVCADRVVAYLKIHNMTIENLLQSDDAIKHMEQIKGFSHQKAVSFVKKTEGSLIEMGLLKELSPYGISFIQINKLRKLYERSVRTEIKENPYLSMRRADIPFENIDAYARDHGFTFCDPDRVRCIVNHMFYFLNTTGNSYCTAEELLPMYRKIERQVSCFDEQVPDGLVLFEIMSSKAGYVDTSTGTPLFYSKRAWESETNIVGDLIRMLRSASELVSEAEIDDYLQTDGNYLDDSQKAAFELLRDTRPSFLIGGPGTGKTTTLKNLVACYLKKYPDKRVAVCAPTGRAAERIKEASGLDAFTIHLLMEYRIEDGQAYPMRNENNPIDADFIIIDEFSMVGIFLFKNFLNAVTNTTKLLFVGDWNQLPSVEPGFLLHDLVNSKKFPYCKLTSTHRQKENSSICVNRDLILSGDTDLKQDDHFVIQRFHNDTEARMKMKDIFETMYDKDNFQKLHVITPQQTGIIGVQGLNLLAQEIFHTADEDHICYGDDCFYIDDKVMTTKNVYGDESYYNGNLWTIHDFGIDEITLSSTDETNVKIHEDHYEDIPLAYATTIHKFQGSEGDIMVIVLPSDIAPSMISRSILYTAETRAIEKVIILSSENMLERFIKAEMHQKRNSGIITKLDNLC